MSKLSELLIVNDKLKSSVKKLYNKTDSDIKEDVQILREWLKKQPQLPQDIDDEEIEKVLMRNKFRIEKTKRKLDTYHSLRGLYSEFFLPVNLNPKALLDSQHACYLFPLRNPTENGERILLYKIRDPNPDVYNLQNHLSLVFAMLEVINKHDYCASTRLICDLANYKFAHYIKFDPITLIKGMKIWQEGYSSSFAGIEYINAPSFTDLLMKIVVNVVKEAKIRVHSSIDSLYDVVPKDDLPDELGGKGGTLDHLQNAWIKELDFQKDFIAHRATRTSNEKLRVGPMLYNDMFGKDGTFKKLNLD